MEQLRIPIVASGACGRGIDSGSVAVPDCSEDDTFLGNSRAGRRLGAGAFGKLKTWNVGSLQDSTIQRTVLILSVRSPPVGHSAKTSRKQEKTSLP